MQMINWILGHAVAQSSHPRCHSKAMRMEPPKYPFWPKWEARCKTSTTPPQLLHLGSFQQPPEFATLGGSIGQAAWPHLCIVHSSHVLAGSHALCTGCTTNKWCGCCCEHISSMQPSKSSLMLTSVVLAATMCLCLTVSG